MDKWIFIGLLASLVRGELLECGAGEMESILNRGEGEESCRPRPAIIRLPDPDEAYSHTTPSHVEVMRCSGSCLHSYHRCIPSKTRTRREKVILSVRSAVPGPVATICAEVEVEDHVECSCGCDVTAGDCNARQIFLPAECRCGCPNIQERDLCVAKGWYWSPELCQCMCPNRPYPICPTGYVFDHESGCDCRPVSFTAFTVLELVIVVIVVGSLAILLSLLHCYRNSIGFFRHRRNNALQQRRRRSASFRQKVELLSNRGGGGSRTVAATTLVTVHRGATVAAEGGDEELVGLANGSPKRQSPHDVSTVGS